MDALAPIITFLDSSMERPTLYGWFHLLFFGLTILTAVLLCRYVKPTNEKQVRAMLLLTSLLVIVLEIYKQFNYSFHIDDAGKVYFDYQWYAFPWQFCSTPMYVGLLAGLTKGKVHRALCAYLGTFALFAGAAVMFYPADVFISTIGINIQTMICHGSMVAIGVWMLYSQYVANEHKTILKAASVFACAIGVAMILNEVFFYSGIIGDETFNMFFISPHFEGTLPVYSLVQPLVPYPLNLLIYIAGFTAAAYIFLLAAMGIRQLGKKKSA
ncbi:MAG: YwaF family protein [Clostridia bacterium]|nr:YwaF family protein [Clostridia bacterium]